MRQLRRAVVAAAWSAWLAGCAVSAIGMAPDRPDQPWVPTTTATGEIVPGARPSAASPEAGYVLPANTDLSGLPAPLGLNRSKAYSLPELIDIAQSNNPQTRTAWNDARNAALVAGIAESTYLPRLRATTVGVYLNNQGNASVPGLNVSTNSEARGAISAASLEWLLFDFGERAAVVEATKQASIIANIAFNATHQQIIYDVSVAFYANAAARARALQRRRNRSRTRKRWKQRPTIATSIQLERWLRSRKPIRRPLKRNWLSSRQTAQQRTLTST